VYLSPDFTIEVSFEHRCSIARLIAVARGTLSPFPEIAMRQIPPYRYRFNATIWQKFFLEILRTPPLFILCYTIDQKNVHLKCTSSFRGIFVF